MSELERPAPSGSEEGGERRRCQRFVAVRDGEPCFWLVNAGQRMALNDLSSEGFSVTLTIPPQPGARFSFVLARQGVPDQVRGEAEVVNYLPGQFQLGCLFVRFADGDAEKLRDWLIAHVLMSASVRISEREAEAIVCGRSLI